MTDAELKQIEEALVRARKKSAEGVDAWNQVRQNQTRLEELLSDGGLNLPPIRW